MNAGAIPNSRMKRLLARATRAVRPGAALLLACATVAACGCSAAPHRPAVASAELVAGRKAADAERERDSAELFRRLVTRAESKPDGSTIDLLIISGGGDWGAFGAGVLKGWGRLHGDEARPQFDVVTGVSTGALIAPFAFLGDDESIERVVHFY